jgi:dynein heavy chain, axonemal
MEALASDLGLNRVPGQWAAVAYPSLKSLSEWFADMIVRVQQLADWSEAAETPNVVWISGLFNPMSYLTAIMQVTARARMLPLDDITLRTVVTNKKEDTEVKEFATEGAYITGFYLEGADWELGRGDEQGYLVDQTLKELHPVLPIMHVTAIEVKDQQKVAIYECPVYVTSGRGPAYVFTAGLQLESEEQSVSKWILSGTCLIMQPE